MVAPQKVALHSLSSYSEQVFVPLTHSTHIHISHNPGLCRIDKGSTLTLGGVFRCLGTSIDLALDGPINDLSIQLRLSIILT